MDKYKFSVNIDINAELFSFRNDGRGLKCRKWIRMQVDVTLASIILINYLFILFILHTKSNFRSVNYKTSIRMNWSGDSSAIQLIWRVCSLCVPVQRWMEILFIFQFLHFIFARVHTLRIHLCIDKERNVDACNKRHRNAIATEWTKKLRTKSG